MQLADLSQEPAEIDLFRVEGQPAIDNARGIEQVLNQVCKPQDCRTHLPRALVDLLRRQTVLQLDQALGVAIDDAQWGCYEIRPRRAPSLRSHRAALYPGSRWRYCCRQGGACNPQDAGAALKSTAGYKTARRQPSLPRAPWHPLPARMPAGRRQQFSRLPRAPAPPCAR